MPEKADSKKIDSLPVAVTETYAVLKRFMNDPDRQKYVAKYKENWDAIENEMWTKKQKGELRAAGMVDLVINRIVKGVQGSAALVTDQKPEIQFFPIGSGDLYVAELLKRAHNIVWIKSDGGGVVYGCTRESKISGTGFIESRHNKFKGLFGKIEMENSCPLDWFWDADSKKRDFSDTDLIKAKKRTVSYLLEKYGHRGVKEDDLTHERGIITEEGKSSGVTGADNFAINEFLAPKDAPGGGKKEPKNAWEIEAWILKFEVEDFLVIYKKDGTPQPMPLTRWVRKDKRMKKVKIIKGKPEAILKSLEKQVKEALGDDFNGVDLLKHPVARRYHRIIVGKKLIDETINPHGVDSDGEPILGVVSLPHDEVRKAFAMCPTDYAVPLNKEGNKRRAQFILSASHNSNAPMAEPIDCDWKGNPGTPGARVIVPNDAPFKPYRIPSGGFDISKFLELEGIAARDIDDQYDMQDVMKGKIPPGQKEMAAKLALALQDMAGMMTKPFIRSFESTLTQIGKINIALILKHWTPEMFERLLEPEEKTNWTPQGMLKPIKGQEGPEGEAPQYDEDQQIKIAAKWARAIEIVTGPEKIQVIDIDVKVTAGSSMPTNRMAKLDVAIQLKREDIYDGEAVLKYIDDPEKDQIIARQKQREEAMMQAELAKQTKGGQ